jgi:hypothetical protein
MNIRKGLLFLFTTFSVTIFSCSKDDIIPGTDPSLEKFVEVQFGDNTIAFNTVDSVIAIFKVPGSVNTIKRKLLAAGNTFAISAQDLSPATYAVEFTVYTKKSQPGIGYSYAYKLKKNITLPLTTTEKTTAPTGNYVNDWAPYFVFRNEEKKVTLIVAERVDDAYFEIQAAQLTGYKLTGLDRSTFGGGNTASYLADHDNWISPNNPLLTGSYSDNNSFSQFAERMKTKEWYKAEIDFMLDDASGNPVYFNHIYYKRP